MGDAAVLEDPLQHEPVEGDLEAVLDLDLDGGLHVADQDVQGAVRRPLQLAAGPRRPGAASRRVRPPGGAGTGGRSGRAASLRASSTTSLLFSGRLWALAYLRA